MKTKNSPWKILINCLIIGLIISSLTSCKKVDCIIDVHWHYVNTTDQTITVLCGMGNCFDGERDFVLVSNGEQTLIENAMANKDVAIEDIYLTPYWSIGATVTIGNNEPIYYDGLGFHEEYSSLQSICNINNYERKKLDDGSFLFTYIFK